MMMNNLKNKGFTLAEVLITLAIIGIVAALTIPTLITNSQKREFGGRLSDTYSTLANAARMAQVEYGDISSWKLSKDVNIPEIDSLARVVEKYFLPYLKVNKNYGTSSTYPDAYRSYKTKDGRNYANVPVRYILELANGVALMFGYDGNNIIIFVDLNGISSPNVLGRDFYAFTFRTSNGLQTYGNGIKSRTSLLEYCAGKESDPHYVGLYCTELIKHDGWKIAEDYPW